MVELVPELIMEIFSYIDFCLCQFYLTITRDDIKIKIMELYSLHQV